MEEKKFADTAAQNTFIKTLVVANFIGNLLRDIVRDMLQLSMRGDW